MKKIFLCLIASMVMVLMGTIIVNPIQTNALSLAQAGYYCDTSYYDTGNDYYNIRQDIPYDSFNQTELYLERYAPNYINADHANACAPMAGYILMGYYDYTFSNLIPNFESGYFYNGTFRYRGQTTETDKVKIQLYNLMGTNTIQPGTSANQFKNGLSAYVNQQGYSLNLTSCNKSKLISEVKTYLNNQIPVVVFANSYEYYPATAISFKNNIYSFVGRKTDNGHVAVIYGYTHYDFYLNGQLNVSRDFFVISFGDGTQGLLAANNLSYVDEAYGVNIF